MTTSASAERWQRLGALLIQRRTALYPRRSRGEFSEATGLSYRLVYDIEEARRTNFGTTVIAGIEAAYRLIPGAIGRFLDGGKLEPQAQQPPPPAAARPHPPGRRRLFPDMPREMRALVDPRIQEIHARIAVAEAARPDSPLDGASLYPDSPLNAERWDTITAQGLTVFPDEGFSLPEAAEVLAIMQLADARQGSGDVAAGLPGRA